MVHLRGLLCVFPLLLQSLINIQRACYLNQYSLMEDDKAINPQHDQATDLEQDSLIPERDEEPQETFEEPEPEFPDDLDPQVPEEVQEEEGDATISNQFFNQVIREQEEFIESLNQAENQLMLDEAFILMISSVCNKKTDEFYSYDHRDDAHLSMVVPF